MEKRSQWVFAGCSQCRLRFPLDLAQSSGQFCPRCGAALRQLAERVPQSADIHEPVKGRPGRQMAGLLDNLRSAQNVGAIFRSADGAGFSALHLCGLTPRPDEQTSIAKTALGSEAHMAWQYAPDAFEEANALIKAGFKVAVLEASEQAHDLFLWQIPAGWQKLVLVAGNEVAGVDPALVGIAHVVLKLPMIGMKGSLNVASAFSIAAYHLRFGRGS